LWVAGLVVCLDLFGDLNLFSQNKLGDVSPCGWMLKRLLLHIDCMVGALNHNSSYDRERKTRVSKLTDKEEAKEKCKRKPFYT
jgi:hypothetical protein